VTVHVVVAVYAGVIEHVSAWVNEADAEKEYHRLRRDYGIKKGLEAESNHVVELFSPVTVRE
jgi:hypothetical protein